jgi:choline kinase
MSDLLGAKHEDAILISYRNGTKYGDEEMKVKVRDGTLLDISKTMDPEEADGENVGMVKFGATGAAILAEELENLVANGALRSWSPRAFLEFTKKRALHVVSTDGYPWIEIDFPEDLQRARNKVDLRRRIGGDAIESPRSREKTNKSVFDVRQYERIGRRIRHQKYQQ